MGTAGSFVIRISLGTCSLKLGFHRPSPGPICAGGTESAVMHSTTSLRVDVAYHVSSSRNTERSNWKSRASTSCSYLLYLCSVISCVTNSAGNMIIVFDWIFDWLFVSRNVTRGMGRKVRERRAACHIDSTLRPLSNDIQPRVLPDWPQQRRVTYTKYFKFKH